MSNPSKLFRIATLMLVFLSPAYAQTNASNINVVVSQNKVRFSIAVKESLLCVKVSTSAGEKVFDSGIVAAASVDWLMQDEKNQPVKVGEYAYLLTVTDLAGNEIARQKGSIIVESGK